MSRPVTSLAAARTRFAVLDEVRDVARQRLSPSVWAYLAGGAGAEQTMRDNETAFTRWRLRPRVLTGAPGVDLTTRVLGLDLSAPLLVAPFGADTLFHPDGYQAVVRACAAIGVSGVVPCSGTYPLEEVRTAAPAGARIFQLPATELGRMLALARRAEDAGYGALCVTVDQPVQGVRDRVRRARFRVDPRLVGAHDEGGRHALGPGSAWFGWTWSRLGELVSRTSLPVLVKGVLTGDDAQAAARIGAAAVVVSNHGGRQLDGTPASLDQLPEVAAAAAPGLAVLLDSGIRRGSDVVKAMALGADAVLVGRPAIFGLAAAGTPGVQCVLELFVEEMRAVLTLLGRESPGELDATVLQPDRRCNHSATGDATVR